MIDYTELGQGTDGGLNGLYFMYSIGKEICVWFPLHSCCYVNVYPNMYDLSIILFVVILI